jgi:4-amino-4-deoxychorismate lyase
MRYFETIKCIDYEIFNLEYHKNRISNTVGLNINLEEYIYPPNNKLLKCKVIYDNSGIIDVEFAEYIKKEINSFKLVYDNTIIYNKKSLDRSCIDILVDKKDDCDEIIIIKDNLVCDTSIANIAILLDDVWLTPVKPLLVGTTMKRLVDENKIKMTNIDISMLYNATKIATLNAMVGFNILNKYEIKG